MPKNLKSGVALAVLSCIASSNVSFAQSSPLEEIVVTATKRTQTLQETPVAVTVTSAETIEQAQILDINDLQSVVPSLRITQLQNSTNTNFVIRGFGNGANNNGIEPSVGVFVDGVFRSRSAGAISDLPSLERVEVLRGPQSTLFGKNASAGVISVVTAKPTGEFGGKVSATVANRDGYNLKGEIEGALSDTVAYKVSGGFNKKDGFVTNLTTGNDINNRDRYNIRGDLLITPNDNLEVRVIADFDNIDEECCASVNLVAGPTLGAIQAAGGDIVVGDDDARTLFSNIDPTNQQDNYGLSVQVDYDFGNVALTSITSYREIDTFADIDADFTSADLLTNDIQSDIETFTQEFRLTSTAGEKIDWQIGAFYFKEDISSVNNLDFGTGFRPFTDALSGGALGAVESALGQAPNTFFSPNAALSENFTLDNEAISIFGQLDYHFNDRLTASVGFNYTDDDKEASVEQTQSDVFSSVPSAALDAAVTGLTVVQTIADTIGLAPTDPAVLAFIANPANGAVVGAVQAGVEAAIAEENPLAALQFLPPTQGFPDNNPFEDGRTSDDELTYTLRLAYDLTDNLNIYASYATGFKASSFNLSRDSRPVASDVALLQAAGLAVPNLTAGTRFADPEEAEVFEIGLKGKFARGAFNIALFDQSLENFQSNTFVGNAFALSNAEEQSVLGAEFDISYYPIDALELTFAATLLDPEFDSFTAGPAIVLVTGDPQTADLTGLQPAGIHEVSFSAAATYSFNIGSNNAFLRGDFYFEDEVATNDNVPESIGAVRETRNLNLAAGLTTEGGYSFSIWARNVTDHDTLISSFPGIAQTGTFNGYRNEPRTYGLSVTKEF